MLKRSILSAPIFMSGLNFLKGCRVVLSYLRYITGTILMVYQVGIMTDRQPRGTWFNRKLLQTQIVCQEMEIVKKTNTFVVFSFSGLLLSSLFDNKTLSLEIRSGLDLMTSAFL